MLDGLVVVKLYQIPTRETTWFLDGAHTIESLDCCIRWFVSPGVGLDNSCKLLVA